MISNWLTSSSFNHRLTEEVSQAQTNTLDTKSHQNPSHHTSNAALMSEQSDYLKDFVKDRFCVFPRWTLMVHPVLNPNPLQCDKRASGHLIIDDNESDN